MTGPELGFLLLCSCFGDPERKALTGAQLEKLREPVRQIDPPGEGHVSADWLQGLGVPDGEAQRICRLLSQEALATHYLERADRLGIRCLTRRSGGYPKRLQDALGSRAPGVLWLRGEEGLLNTEMVALVGARNAAPESLDFAQAVGRAAAGQGFTLISGGARGCDTAAETACLAAGGRVIRVLPDPMDRHRQPEPRLLYLCEDSFDLPFSSRRALSRNLLIHALASVTLVAQSGLSGGTWDGTTRNLRHGWSPVYLSEATSPAAKALLSRGARLLPPEGLADLSALTARQESLF